ncbi:hypothetical protein FRB90_003456 [Tulasnella sp. 427]|nr:hypothetical protein FRB90_003456 [Tulasnella sp. 427]
MVILEDSKWNEWYDYIYPDLNSLNVWECIDPGWDKPVTNPTTADEKKESINAANKREVKGKDAKAAFTALKASHNKVDAGRQFQLFQSMLSIQQDAQDGFVQAIRIAGSLSHSNVTTHFWSEQMRRDTAATAKNFGLAARANPGGKKDKKRTSAKCSHCGKAHPSSECWKTYPSKKQAWIYSGAMSSMTPHHHWLRNIIPCHVPVRVATDQVFYATGRGEVVLQPVLDGVKTEPVVFSRKRGVTVQFSKEHVVFEQGGETFMTASYHHKAAFLDGTTIPASESALSTSTPPPSLALWHRRLAHIDSDRLKKLVELGLAKGIEIRDKELINSSLAKLCEPCLAGKQHRHPFPHSSTVTFAPLKLVVSNLHGPLPPTNEGFKYWLLFICEFQALAEKQSGCKIKRFRDDKGGKYIGKKWDAHMSAQGIIHERTTVNTPQQNGIAEHKNWTLEEAITSMLAEAKLPRAVWAQALSLAVRISNASPTSSLKDKTLFEAFYGVKPDLSMLQVFGCCAYMHVQKEHREDAKWHTQRCIYLGFEDGYKGFKCHNPETNNRCWCTRRSCSTPSSASASPSPPPSLSPPPAPCDSDDYQEPGGEDSSSSSSSDDQPGKKKRKGVGYKAKAKEVAPTTPIKDEPAPEPDRRYSGRVRGPPKEFWKVDGRAQPPRFDEPGGDEQDEPESDEQQVDSAAPTGGNQNAVSEEEEQDASESEAHSVLQALKIVYPNEELLTHDEAIEHCYNQLSEDLCSYHALAAICTILALAAIHDWEIESIDISNAYLNGVLPEEETVYMREPEGFQAKSEDWVCRLRKGLYGLKQSGRLWYQKLGEVLEGMGFIRLVSDPSIYVWGKDGLKVIVLVSVDDLALVSKSKARIQEVKDALAKVFKIQDLGPTSFLLGVYITCNQSSLSLSLSQHQYTANLLERFGMSNCTPVTTPMEPGLKLTKEMSPSTAEEMAEMKGIPYLNAVGALNYLTIVTCPDISYTVGKLACFNSKPGMQHWKAVKHLFRYLQRTKDMKLTYAPDPLRTPSLLSMSRAINHCCAL